MKKNRKNFKILLEKLLYGYELLCLNENLHKEVKDNYYHDNNFQEIWDKILISLEIRYWLELAKIFDRSKYRKKSRSGKTITTIKVISIQDFFPNYKLKFKGFLLKIGRIIKFRNEFIAHTNQKAARNPEKRLKELGLKRSDAWSLFERTIVVLDESKNDYKYKNIESSLKKIELRIQKKVKKFIEYSDRDASRDIPKSPRISP